VGRTAVGSHRGTGEMICDDLYVTGTGFKNHLTLMTMMMIIIMITMTKMIMVIMMTMMMMIHLFRAADTDMSISELFKENKLNRLNKIFHSTHKPLKA
jgi:hypothetical protein